VSCDFGIWHTDKPITPREAQRLYERLCEGEGSVVEPHVAVDALYQELTASHPEIDDVPEERLDDHELCPWSCAMDRTPGSLVICSVWSRADQTKALLLDLVTKHGLTLYDPQAGVVHQPPGLAKRRPWWKLW